MCQNKKYKDSKPPIKSDIQKKKRSKSITPDADDSLSWGDEEQTRRIFEDMFDYYVE